MVESNNIASLFFIAAGENPDHVAIVDHDRSVTYKHLAGEVKEYAYYLSKKGIVAGDRILIFVPMGIELYKTVLATFYIGAVAVFLDEWVGKERMEICCRIAQCKGFIAPFKIRFLSLLSKELRNIPIHLNSRSKNHQVLEKMYEVKGSATALITFTTGSTGTPKAADRTHHFLQKQYDALLPILPVDSKKDMTLLPIVLLLNLGKGISSVIGNFNPRKPEKFDPAIIYFQLQEEAVQSITFSPYFLVELSKYLIEQNLKLPELRYIISGGGPLFPSEAEIIVKAFPETTCTIVYGSTEAEPIAHTDMHMFLQYNATNDLNNGLYVGKTDHAAKVKILRMGQENIEELPEGEIGEIIVSGPHVLTAYFNSEAAYLANKINIAGVIWHRTGDAGWLNANEEIFLMGRCKQIITWKNKRYFPFLIEQHLKTIHGIIKGTLLQTNDKILLVVQPEKNYTAQEIKTVLHMNGYSEFEVRILPNIPLDKRHNTKIDYAALKQSVHEI